MQNFAKSIAVVLLVAFFFACTAKQPVNIQPVKILIPFYSYPTWYNPETYFWTQVTQAASRVSITAVINPNNGPGSGAPNQDYVKGLDDLRSANVTILGYVFTSYGKRNLAEVKSDIDLYDKYYNIDGIFFDEAASGVDKLDYYQELYNYTKAKPNLETVVLNQGTQTDEGYLKQAAADIIVLFENYGKAWEPYQVQPYVKRYSSARFSCLIHTVPDAATMRTYIDLAAARNIQYVYITDDSPDDRDRDPWNRLPSYWQEEVDYIQSLSQK
jgi:Spherulation-specific family 4